MWKGIKTKMSRKIFINFFFSTENFSIFKIFIEKKNVKTTFLLIFILYQTKK